MITPEIVLDWALVGFIICVFSMLLYKFWRNIE